ncbi:MAG: anhydro-N-acetylmuramic acid kinase [Bacteroidetes bacterium]|nr:anhydro-N-acetylmuramic acid kinase [Bacteroidota bacterium]
MKSYNVIGVMSGTSLDGVDIAYCVFSEEEGKWSYFIKYAELYKYDEYWSNTLQKLENTSAFDFVNINILYGHYIGKLIKNFIEKYNIQADFIASHGHTIFHQPEKMITCQIGDGAAIAAETGVAVICDFRSLDVALGGQGAPLVPIGDKLLFSEFDFCLNLGGIANVSFDNGKQRIAFDICPVNIALNRIAKNFGKAYDDNGCLASKGQISQELLSNLNDLDYYKIVPPKSLGKEWIMKYFIPIIDKYNISDNDKLCTICEHIALQISKVVNFSEGGQMLVTGGGAFNSFLISRIKHFCKCVIIIPDSKTIEYKEALIFAFLGVLRMNNKNNCLSSVTGASRDNVGGAVYLGKL